jgi:PPOX class probable F420-dependent enzyme
MSRALPLAVDGDRVYFRTWSGSGPSKRLGHTGRVLVAPCTVLGLCSFGPPFNATARRLAGEQAGRAARKLADEHPARHRLLTTLSRWTRRWQPVHYELLADEAPEHQTRPAENATGSAFHDGTITAVTRQRLLRSVAWKRKPTTSLTGGRNAPPGRAQTALAVNAAAYTPPPRDLLTAALAQCCYAARPEEGSMR